MTMMAATQPRAARAMLSTEDFGLLREAVASYARQIADDPRSSKFVSLHHRLGRAGR
jgi:hypothetical protein